MTVNIPEPTPDGSAAANAGFATVSQITEARITKAMETVPSAVGAGLRVERLASSNFRVAATSAPEDLFDLRESTLDDGDHVMEHIVQEVLLKEGVRLDAPWERHQASGAPLIIADGVAVVMSVDLTQAIADAAFSLKPKVVVFLEDGFADADAVKANAFTNAKVAGILMKTV
jgi:adenine-specific DNA-methyltransferase